LGPEISLLAAGSPASILLQKISVLPELQFLPVFGSFSVLICDTCQHIIWDNADAYNISNFTH